MPTDSPEETFSPKLASGNVLQLAAAALANFFQLAAAALGLTTMLAVSRDGPLQVSFGLANSSFAPIMPVGVLGLHSHRTAQQQGRA
jgi:hypothetical protein